jgi:exosortase/archaeosortase family protein
MVAKESRTELALNVTRVIVIASTIAVVLYYVPNYYLYERIVAEHSAALMEVIGIKATIWTQGNRVFLNQFEIQKMCTGVQVMTVFLGLIVAIPKVAVRKKILAFSVVAVGVHLANIGRIALEIWLLYNGILPWSLAHYPTGLILGIFSVAFLVVAADHFIPEIGDLAFSLIDGSSSR